ncbi:uncharacterized protein [Nicotiana sylvestris]|uniref:uncharacterized protein n=1 Tax=Nicotiana sylvestris TaxID=4096 RepID=UPI00388C93BC
MTICCELCGDSHMSDMCPTNPESIYYVGQQNKGPPNQHAQYGNSYNPNWRNHPNFSWGGNKKNQYQHRPQGNFNQPQRPPQQMEESTNDLLKKFLIDNQQLRTDFRNLERQMSQVQLNIPLVDVLHEIPKYAKYIKDIVAHKRRLTEFETVALTEECISRFQNKLPQKLKDPGSFTIPVRIGNIDVGRALCDLGESINLMPLSLFKQLGLGAPRPTTMMLQLADRSIAHPEGVIEDVLLQIRKFIFPADFIILSYEADELVPIILGRPLLATGDAIIKEEKLLRVLREHKRALGWTMSDIKGISPAFFMHKILMEDGHKPSKIEQCHLEGPLSPPFIDQMLDRLAGQEYYCFLDGYSGYNQIAIALEDQEKTTFMCPYGTYAFKRMPFGLCNVPATFQRCMVSIFTDMVERFVEEFMENVSMFGCSFDNFLMNLDKVLARCEETNLVLNWEKCHFMVREGIVLGHKVSKDGLQVDKAKVEAIEKLSPPISVKGIRSFLGHAGFYRRFIKDFSKISSPLYRSLEKDVAFKFDDACLKAFEELKVRLVTAPIIIAPNWENRSS